MRSFGIHKLLGCPRTEKGLLTLFVISSAFSPSMYAQEGGVVAEFCKDARLCVDDVLEIVFESGSSTYEGPFDVGVEVPIEVVIDTKTPGIQGYSWAVKHDRDVLELIAESVTTAGTIIDPENPDTPIRGEPFMVHRAVQGGFFSAVVLSLLEQATLPLGRNAVCRAEYRLTAAPKCTIIRFVHLQVGPGGASPSVGINITASGHAKAPRLFRHGLIRTGDCAETCDDLADNDGDGLADCDDPDCAAEPRCTGEEICDDGIDNNSNSAVDCLDHFCRGILDCPDLEACADGIDNDGDGLADCDDPECSWKRPCLPAEVCDDGADNDRDSLTDCDDGDCTAVSGCPQLEVCDDGIDNDGDSLADCDDLDCSESGCETMFNHGKPVEVCDDGIDNDGDGFVDGLDSDCYLSPLAGAFPPTDLIRGDADGSGRLTVLDAVVLIRVAVNGEAPPFDCFLALDTNGDAGINVADALPILRWIFLDAPPLPSPFPECGTVSGSCRESSPGCR